MDPLPSTPEELDIILKERKIELGKQASVFLEKIKVMFKAAANNQVVNMRLADQDLDHNAKLRD